MVFPHKLFLVLLLLAPAGSLDFSHQRRCRAAAVVAPVHTHILAYARVCVEVGGGVKACGGGCQVERVNGGGAL